MAGSRKHSGAAAKLFEIGVAAPQVVARRVARMAVAGPVPSARDRREFTAMVVEKQVAFTQSWLAMGMEMFKLQQRLFWSWMRNPWMAGRQLPAMGQSVVAKGLEPVRRKAVANARRLGRRGGPR